MLPCETVSDVASEELSVLLLVSPVAVFIQISCGTDEGQHTSLPG